MSGDLLLAIDNGTQSVRALLFDASGELVARQRVALDDYTSPQPGWHEHDAEGFWRAACEACAGLWAQDARLRERVAGIAVTTQRGTIVCVDERGVPLRPAIIWLDQRKAPHVPSLSARWRAAFAAARVGETVRYFQHEAEVNYLAACEPDLWRRTHKVLLLSGYLLYRLCGRFVESTGSLVGYLPFDFKRLEWANARDWKWEALAIRPEQLPQLVTPATPLGPLTDSAADALGVARGTPLIAAAADKACEVLGSGCLDPSVGALSYGTTATINACTPRYVEATPFVPPYPAAIARAYDAEVQIFRGYWMVSWFKEQFGLLERQASERGGAAAEALFDELVRAVPAGSMGLMLQPYWTPGIKTPGPEAKGAIVGFGDVHTRAHVYRAILEGLAFALREGKERIERRTRVPMTALRVAGGGSQSDEAMQITADVFGLPCARPHVYEASGLGAAIDAAVGLRLHAGFADAARAMTRVGRTFEPQAQHRELYDALYTKVYVKMYDRLRPLYESIRSITGYPPSD